MRVVLIRHPAPMIEPGLCYGRLDIALKAPAAEIAAIAADPAMSGMRRIWTSPARRCRAMADPIAGALATEISIDPRLQELDFGAWEGKPWNMISRAELDAWAASPLDFAPPGGETGACLLERVVEFHAELRALGRDCAVFSHGGPLKILGALLEGAPPDLLAPAPPLGSLRVVTC